MTRLESKTSLIRLVGLGATLLATLLLLYPTYMEGSTNGRSLQAISSEQQHLSFDQEFKNKPIIAHYSIQDGRVSQTESSDQTLPRTLDNHEISSEESYQSNGRFQNEGEPSITIFGWNSRNCFYEKKS